MADEAVLRIVLDDKSKGTGGSSTGGGSGPNTGAGSGGGASSSGAFDPAAEAYKQFEADKRRAAIEVERAKLQPFDPADEARKRFEKDKKRAEIDIEHAKLVPPPDNPPFDPVVEAKKRLEKDRQRAAIDAEEAKLRPAPPFDPLEEARKQREGERRRAQIKAAYKQEYGDDEKETGLDQFLKVADSLRGTLGGIFGSTVGAVLDVVSGVRKARVDARKENREQNLLAEAEETTKEVATEIPNVLPTNIPNALPITQLYPPTQPTQLYPPTQPTQLYPPTQPTQLYPPTQPTQLYQPTQPTQLYQPTQPTQLHTPPNTPTEASVPTPSNNTTQATEEESTGGAFAAITGPLAVVGIAVTGAVTAFIALTDAIDKTVERYSEYSAEISQAQALAEVRNTMGDLRRAREIGPELVQYIQAQSDLQQKYEDVKVKILMRLAPVVTQILDILGTIVASGEVAMKGFDLLAAPLNTIARALDQLVGIQQDDRMPEGSDPTLQLFDTRFTTPGMGGRGEGWAPPDIPQ